MRIFFATLISCQNRLIILNTLRLFMHVMIFLSKESLLNALENKNEFSMHLNGHKTDRHFQTNRFELAYEINPRVLSFSTQKS